MEPKIKPYLMISSYLLPGIVITYPCVFFYYKNLNLVPFSSFLQLFFVLFIFSSILLAILIKLLKFNAAKAIIFVTILALGFNTYGYFFTLSEKLDWFIVEHYNFFPFFIILTIFLSLLTVRIPDQKADSIVRVVSIIACFLISLNILGIVYKAAKYTYSSRDEMRKKTTYIDQGGNFTSDNKLPDVYYLLFDEAAAFNVVTKYSDNVKPEAAIDFFSENNFVIFENSKANSIYTLHQLAQRLNSSEYPVGMDYHSMYDQKILESSVVNKFHKLGYTIIAYDQRRDKFPNDNPFPADVLIETVPESSNNKSIFLDDYKLMVLRLTLLKKWMNIDPKTQYHRNFLFYVRNHISTEITKGPKLVYAHLMLPHEPFAFNADGSLLSVESGYKNWGNYFSNYNFFLSYSQDITKEIFNSKSPSKVVIIQSDHGPRMLTDFGYSGQIPNFLEDDKLGIINMVYYPQCDIQELEKIIDPIRTFEVILRCIEINRSKK